VKTGREAAKIRGEMPSLNNFKSILKNYAYTFQNTKDYLFDCCTLTEANDWIGRNWLYGFFSPYKHKCIDCGRKILRKKTAR
jgi:hypothetical protein